MLFLALAQQGLLLVAGRNGVSRLLAYWSPTWELSSLAPTFLMQPPTVAWTFAAIWLAAIAAAAAVAWRLRGGRELDAAPGRAGLAACGIAGGALVLVGLLVQTLLAGRGAPAPAASARTQSTLLSEFDAQRRPLGVVYDPFRRVPASAIPPLLAFAAGPRARGERAGADLLYDTRWALPAGRYEIDLDAPPGGPPLQGELGLHVGRIGPPLLTWTIAPTSRWTTTVDLAANARYVGFKASPDLAGTGAVIRIVPLAVPDLRTRRTDPDVVQSRQYGAAAVFFYDERIDPEPTGFWTRGDSESRLAVALSPAGPTTLRLRAGPVPARVRVTVDGYTQRLSLAPHEEHDVALRSRHTVASVELATEGGFVPAALDPATRDRRRLGVWAEVLR